MVIAIKHGFDSLENHNPHYSSVLGYTQNEDEAKDWIIRRTMKDKKFKGYDGKIYPYYTTQTISELI